jgi:peptidoglycan/LPS O-acetylase OafA/YrhL
MTPPPTVSQPVRVDELDGLRGLLALWVAVAHVFCWSGWWEIRLPGAVARLWKEFLGAGPAVDAFIILSGFAISFLLHKRQQSYGEFMTGRFFRIYPVYGICLLLGLATTWLMPFILQTASWHETIFFGWMGSISASETAAPVAHLSWHATLLHGLVPKQILPDSTGTLLTPAWSISLEWQYYLVAPLLALLVRTGAGLLLVACLAWLGARYAAPWMNPHPAFLPAQLPLFLIGIASYHLYAGFSAHSAGRSRRFTLPAAALLGVALLVNWHPIALSIWALGFGCIFAQGDDMFSRLLVLLRKFLLHPWLQWLGKISFPLYLVHWPLLLLFLSALLRFHPSATPLQTVLLLLFVGLPLILCAAVALHKSVEMPMMAYGKKVVRRNQPEGAAKTA